MIVAIDGASTDLSVALAEPDGSLLAEEAWTGAQRQSSELLPRLLAVLDREGAGLDRASAFAVGAGPGSFTGLRVAMALAKGLAFALRRPIVGVPSLVAWLEAEPEATAALARSGAREAYVLARGEPEPLIGARDRISERLGASPVVAPGELAAAFGLTHATTPRGAGGVAMLAARRLGERPEGDDLRRLEPTYLRTPRGVAAEAEVGVRWL